MSRVCWRWRWLVSAPVLVLAVCACAGDPHVVAVRPLPPSTLAQAGIGDVNVVDQTPRPYAGVASALRRALGEAGRGCARGPRLYTPDVRIERFKPRSFGWGWRIGDIVRLMALVRVIEPETGTVAAEYRIDEWRGGAGQTDVDSLAEAEWKLPWLFAARFCQEVLRRAGPP